MDIETFLGMQPMPTINITPATTRIAEAGGLFIERDTVVLSADDGVEQTVDSVVIGEDNSDFLIVYLVGSEALSLYLYPSYIADMPPTVSSSVELRNLVKKLTQEFIKAS